MSAALVWQIARSAAVRRPRTRASCVSDLRVATMPPISLPEVAAFVDELAHSLVGIQRARVDCFRNYAQVASEYVRPLSCRWNHDHDPPASATLGGCLARLPGGVALGAGAARLLRRSSVPGRGGTHLPRQRRSHALRDPCRGGDGVPHAPGWSRRRRPAIQ
jgi:hypothetical protein